MAASPAPEGPGLWDAHGGALAATLPSATELLARSRAAVEGGRPGQAAAGLALALRADPTLAPQVLDLLAGRSEPVLALVRGDAHRIVGHEAEATRDYAAAVAAMSLERSSDRGERASDNGAAQSDRADGDGSDGRAIRHKKRRADPVLDARVSGGSGNSGGWTASKPAGDRVGHPADRL